MATFTIVEYRAPFICASQLHLRVLDLFPSALRTRHVDSSLGLPITLLYGLNDGELLPQ